MKKLNKNNAHRRLVIKPLRSVLYLSETNQTQISGKSITFALVGKKAFGLSCLPAAWTLPFIVVSDKLVSEYKNCPTNKQNTLLNKWGKRIITALLSEGILEDDLIIVRSSGCLEGLEERGKFHSAQGMMKDIVQTLADCFEKNAADKDWNKQKMPLVIQKCVDRLSAKGHLSNERQWYEEDRDWLGQFEEGIKTGNESFEIHLRSWRKETPAPTKQSIKCNLIANVSEALRIPATWAYNKHSRLHFEWVWNSETVYIVQADQESKEIGVDPTKIYEGRFVLPIGFTPKCLKEINQVRASKYNKIQNILTYVKLKLPVVNLYVLDDQVVIRNLSRKVIPANLQEDIQMLVKNPLVIRMDIATNDKKKNQMLPRTEVLDVKSALDWLIKSSFKIQKEVKENIIFIFHNFVPAISSAFAYAAPNERKVQIEALWGLPEGLHFYAQDKYIVDTLKQKAEELGRGDINNFKVQGRKNYKRYFVAPNKNGQWGTKILKPNYDWRFAIQKPNWVKEIAFESRRIADEEGKSLSIMWFIGVLPGACARPVFPWHHEPFDPQKISRALKDRTKTPYDKTLVIRRGRDLKELAFEARKQNSYVRLIRIQPQEDRLLRDKYMLRDIGEKAKKIGATILLEGGELSHAYYQLLQTQAIVQVEHPFVDAEEKRDFNKLVRDKVPNNVERGGEIVRKARLSGELLLRALREKLIEEAFEVLDATHQDSIVNELADVSEVIDEILFRLGVSREELIKLQEQKRDRAGGFRAGLVLVETKNPLPTKKGKKEEQTLFDKDSGINKKEEFISIDERAIIEFGHKMKERKDRRDHPAAREEILYIIVPIVKDNWSADTSEIVVDSGKVFRGKLAGEREGSKFKLKLSIFVPQKQASFISDK